MFDKFNAVMNPENAQCYKRCTPDKKPIGKNLYYYDDLVDETDALIGYVVQKPYVVIDIDDRDDAKKIVSIITKENKKCWINTSTRGAHLIFKDSASRVTQGAHTISGLGIEVDSRVADKGYIILPINAQHRKWYRVVEGDEIDEIPAYLIPQSRIKDVPNMNDLGDGEGRNDKLFKHFLKLGEYSNLKEDEIKETIRIINKYIFSKPLSDDELEHTLLRPEIEQVVHQKVVDREVKVSRADKLLKVAENVMQKEKTICCDNALYRYNGKYFEFMSEEELHSLIFNKYQSNLSKGDRLEVIEFIKLKSYIKPELLNKDWYIVNLLNGRLNLKTGELLPHTPTVYDTLHVETAYVLMPPRSERIENFLEFVSDGDDNKRQVLLEMAGYCLLKSNCFQKAYILFGGGRNGKSTYLQMISNMLGESKTSSVDLQSLITKEYMAFQLFGKLANVADDISFKNIGETELLKKLISGDRITANIKYQKPIEYHNYATMIFATNKLPKTADRSFGFERRFEVIDFTKLIENPDPMFIERLTAEDYEYLLKIAVEAIRVAIANNNLTSYHKSAGFIKKYMLDSNSLRSFISEEEIDIDKLVNTSVADLYSRYKLYSVDNGFKMMSRYSFITEMEDMMDITTKSEGGRLIWIEAHMQY